MTHRVVNPLSSLPLFKWLPLSKDVNRQRKHGSRTGFVSGKDGWEGRPATQKTVAFQSWFLETQPSRYLPALSVSSPPLAYCSRLFRLPLRCYSHPRLSEVDSLSDRPSLCCSTTKPPFALR